MNKTNSKSRKIMSLIIIMAMIVTTIAMSATAFAEKRDGALISDQTDYNTNATENKTSDRQKYSALTAWTRNGEGAELVGESNGVITLGKILNTNQKDKFPNIEDFIYKVTPISAWENANTDTTKSGATITKSDMPKPSGGKAVDPHATGSGHHLVANYGSGNDWYTYVSIGNFKDATQDNTSTIDHSDANSNTTNISEGYRRTRTTDLKFNFTKAGYYMYKVEEVGSIKNGPTINPAQETDLAVSKDVSGVDYDNNTYYVVFYVANKQATADDDPNQYGQGTQKGDTSTGTYVHSITSWSNSQTTDNKPANAQDSDALKSGKDLMETLDNNGAAANLNTGSVNNDNNGKDNTTVSGNTAASNGKKGEAKGTGNTNNVSGVTHTNGKVGLSDSTPGPTDVVDTTTDTSPYYIPSLPSGVTTVYKDGPNKLEAYRMWNAQIAHDVVLKKNVTGTLGDRNKQFLFTVELAGLENSTKYTTNVKSGSADNDISDHDQYDENYDGDTTSNGIKLIASNDGSSVDNSGTYPTFTTNATGGATFDVKLKDDEILVINGLPRGATYKITEAKSDHVPQYDIVSNNKDVNKKVSDEQNAEYKEKTAFIAKVEDKSKESSNVELATEVESVDRYDGTVTVIFQNNRDLPSITGLNNGMLALIAAAVVLLIAAFIFMRRRQYGDDEE